MRKFKSAYRYLVQPTKSNPVKLTDSIRAAGACGWFTEHPEPVRPKTQYLWIFVMSIIIVFNLSLGVRLCRRLNKIDLRVSKIFVYPIKSCGVFETDEWPMESYGFRYDRNWAVISERGECITQMEEPKLCLVRPHVDLRNGTMTLVYAGKLQLDRARRHCDFLHVTIYRHPGSNPCPPPPPIYIYGDFRHNTTRSE